MDRKQLVFVLEQKHCLQGGIQEARIKALAFMSHAVATGGVIQSPESCVLGNEFLDAVRVLIAYAHDKEDVVPDTSPSHAEAGSSH